MARGVVSTAASVGKEQSFGSLKSEREGEGGERMREDGRRGREKRRRGERGGSISFVLEKNNSKFV